MFGGACWPPHAENRLHAKTAERQKRTHDVPKDREATEIRPEVMIRLRFSI